MKRDTLVKHEDRVMLTASIRRVQMAKVNVQARREGRSRSSLVRRALAEYLKRHGTFPVSED